MTIIKTIEKISFAMALTLLFFSNAHASIVNDPINEYNSMYRYNALENSFSFRNLTVDNIEEKSPSIGEVSNSEAKELQDITEKQNFSIKQTDNAINVFKNRNEVKTFLIGNNLGALIFQLVRIKDEIYMLNALSLKSQDNTNKIQIDNQVKILKEEQKKVEDFILEQKSEFSLFGWFVNIL